MITAQNLHKQYREGEKNVVVLNGLDLQITPGKKIGIIGPSGAGKSTLLHILGGLDQPTSGTVSVEGEDFYRLSDAKRSDLRNRYFGFVFQFYHLLPELNALENVLLPALIAGVKKSEATSMARHLLEQVGLAERVEHYPSELSGGEQQRVALARACILKPKIILADEPTGNLDEKTGESVFQTLLGLVRDTGGALVLVTHNKELLKNMDVVFELKNGNLVKTA